jgi:hypothetical protein
LFKLKFSFGDGIFWGSGVKPLTVTARNYPDFRLGLNANEKRSRLTLRRAGANPPLSPRLYSFCLAACSLQGVPF